MNKPKLITSYNKFSKSYVILENEYSDSENSIDETILDAIVDLVGSEEEVEECAREAYEELQKSFERDELATKEGDTAEKLVIAALIVKLVEKGKLGPAEADNFIDGEI
jgi:hypothetical protein